CRSWPFLRISRASRRAGSRPSSWNPMFFDIGWSELLVIGVVALVFIGPKDLPRALRVAGYWFRKARTLSREFQNSVDQMIREAELDEMREQRNRLMWAFGAIIVAFLVCYQFKEMIYRFLAHPLAEIYAGEPGRKMIFTALTEAFFTYVKVSFWAALCLSFPIVAIQVWKFVAPGLYKNERHAFLPYLCATPVLFTMGASLAYF